MQRDQRIDGDSKPAKKLNMLLYFVLLLGIGLLLYRMSVGEEERYSLIDSPFLLVLMLVPVFLIIWIQEKTLRKYAQKALAVARELEQEKQRFESLFVHHPDVIFVVNRNGIIIDMNPGKIDKYGTRLQHLIGLPFLLLVVPEDRGKVLEHFRNTLQGATRSFITAAIDVQKQRMELSYKLIPIYKDAEVSGAFVMTKDVTEQNDLQREIIEKKEKLDTLIQSSLLAISVVDPEGRIRVWNKGAENIFGWSEEELLGQHTPTITHEQMQEQLDMIKQGKIIQGEEVRRKRKDGTPIDLRLSLSRLNNADGEYNGVIMIAEDITVRKKHERRAQLDMEMARKIQESVLSPPLEDEKISIHSTYLPSYKLSGDMYCWFPIDERRYGIMMLDVMGHGVSSCLISMSIRSLLRGMIIRVQEPELIFAELNKHMSGLFQKQLGTPCFFTATYLLIDTGNKSIHYINAGNPPGILYDESGQIHLLASSSPPIGLRPEQQTKAQMLHYTGHTRIMLYSDGVLGKRSLEKGIEELQERFMQHRHWKPDDFSRMMANGDDQDDICVVVADLHGENRGITI
ncbi:MAG TPA: PAS domain S-box protein [Candidatus Bathyarchaeia archaeon]|nr:PAS domain S-box protein [Candidatus Bathyarchaeia archaeon]